ncbi:acetyltransferase [Devosia geojensis]|uniref:Acetyltransferase n=1 Tax=Devosia geojensis TaxID=443610 RepID=A0A0F5FR55_9HYPH|nr:GNAT family N-acetyltransferase [Devosia geojensis]KKB11346.1 acetyltransferase [Devosia geojensis]
MPMTIRQARDSDRADLFRICLLTADSGADASALYSDPHYPGLVWSVPYLDFAPEHAFVLDDGNEVLGYVVGAGDTEAFEARLESAWWPKLAETYSRAQATAKLDAMVLERIRKPQPSDPAIVRDYPAHLHINLLPPAQSGGWGRRLIETELASLKAAGAPAVHLGVSLRNERAMGFYRHVGFSEISRGSAVWFGRDL